MSQMPCTSYATCADRSEVERVRLSPNKLAPGDGRSPGRALHRQEIPCSSPVHGHLRPETVSVCDQESFSHVLLPNSPARESCGRRETLPVARRKSRMKPFRSGWRRRQMRGADDDTSCDDGRGVSPFALLEIDGLIVFLFQIDDAVPAEPGGRKTGLRVERDHLVAGRDVDDARLLRGGAGPVRQPATGQLPRCGLAPLAFVLAVHPQHLAGGGVEGHDRAACTGGRVHDAVDHQRRALKIELGTRAERVGLEPPRDLERVEVLS